MINCKEDLEVAFLALNRNPVLIYSNEISELTLANLKERRPKAFDAIRVIEHRKALVRTGLFSISPSKGAPENVELEYSQQAAEEPLDNNIRRFRSLFLGLSTFIRFRPDDWRFNPDVATMYLNRFDGFNYVQELIECLFLLIQPCDDGKSAWRMIVDDPNNSILRPTTSNVRTLNRFCGEILEKEMKNNVNIIRGLLY
jgi:hypothetical protein